MLLGLLGPPLRSIFNSEIRIWEICKARFGSRSALANPFPHARLSKERASHVSGVLANVVADRAMVDLAAVLISREQFCCAAETSRSEAIPLDHVSVGRFADEAARLNMTAWRLHWLLTVSSGNFLFPESPRTIGKVPKPTCPLVPSQIYVAICLTDDGFLLKAQRIKLIK